MFDRALKIILRHEGGYSDHPSDPGGATMYGITKRVAEENGYHGDMRQIPMAVVEMIYRRRYWNKIMADEMPWPVALVTFDAAVNSGPSRAAKWLQQALSVTADGVIGQQTLRALEEAAPEDVARWVCGTRLAYLKALKTWPVFGRGWERRVRETLAAALS